MVGAIGTAAGTIPLRETLFCSDVNAREFLTLRIRCSSALGV